MLRTRIDDHRPLCNPSDANSCSSIIGVIALGICHLFRLNSSVVRKNGTSHHSPSYGDSHTAVIRLDPPHAQGSREIR